MAESSKDTRTIEHYGPWCISDRESKPCFGKPCSCIVCLCDTFCVEEPCLGCSGTDHDRTNGFCCPTDEELATARGGTEE